MAASVTGFADGPPVKAGPAITDFISGVHLYAGIMTALYDREKSGRGRLVEIAMVETVYPAMASNLADVFNRKAAAPRTGNRHGGFAEAPYNVYAASDGYVAIISVNESHWTGLTRAMGRPELAEDPRLKTVLDRLTREPSSNVAFCMAAVPIAFASFGDQLIPRRPASLRSDVSVKPFKSRSTLSALPASSGSSLGNSLISQRRNRPGPGTKVPGRDGQQY